MEENLIEVFPSRKDDSIRQLGVNSRDRLGTVMNMNESGDVGALEIAAVKFERVHAPPVGARGAGWPRFRIPPRICQIECDVVMDAALAVLPARPR